MSRIIVNFFWFTIRMCNCQDRNILFCVCFWSPNELHKDICKHSSIARIGEMVQARSGIRYIILIQHVILQYPHQMRLYNYTRGCGQMVFTGALHLSAFQSVLFFSCAPRVYPLSNWWIVTVGCVCLCDGVSNCLRVFPARHLKRSNSVLITLPLLQSSCHCRTIYFFISNKFNTIDCQFSFMAVCHLFLLHIIFIYVYFLPGNSGLCFKVSMLFFPIWFHLPSVPVQLWLKDMQAWFTLFFIIIIVIKEQWGHFPCFPLKGFIMEVSR